MCIRDRTTDVPDPFIGENTAPNDVKSVPDVQIVASTEPSIVAGKAQHVVQQRLKETATQTATEKDEEEKKGAWKTWDEG